MNILQNLCCSLHIVNYVKECASLNYDLIRYFLQSKQNSLTCLAFFLIQKCLHKCQIALHYTLINCNFCLNNSMLHNYGPSKYLNTTPVVNQLPGLADSCDLETCSGLAVGSPSSGLRIRSWVSESAEIKNLLGSALDFPKIDKTSCKLRFHQLCIVVVRTSVMSRKC